MKRAHSVVENENIFDHQLRNNQHSVLKHRRKDVNWVDKLHFMKLYGIQDIFPFENINSTRFYPDIGHKLVSSRSIDLAN